MGTAIYSQDSELSKVDYRRYDFNVSYRSVKLPGKVEYFCRLMLQGNRLRFGTFDFIYSKDGNYFFLELNPNGQWLWLEQLTDLKISKVLANYLTGNHKE